MEIETSDSLTLFFTMGIYLSCSNLTDGETGLWRMGWDYLRWCSRTVAGLCEAPRAASRRSGYLKMNLSWPQTPQLPFRKQSRQKSQSLLWKTHLLTDKSSKYRKTSPKLLQQLHHSFPSWQPWWCSLGFLRCYSNLWNDQESIYLDIV